MGDGSMMGPIRHITQPIICSMISTFEVDQAHGASHEAPRVEAMICKVCGDPPKVFTRPQGKVKPIKQPKTPEQRKMDLEKILGEDS